MTEHVRIYVNGQSVEAHPGSTILEALERFDPVDAAAVRHGEKVVTDSRGLAADPAATVYNGAIYRLVRARGSDADQSSEF